MSTSDREVAEAWPPNRVWLPNGTAELSAVSPELQNVEGDWWVRESTIAAALTTARTEQAERDAEAQGVCWHCGDVLAYVPKPRCERCPTECDEEGCEAMGCVDEIEAAAIRAGAKEGK